MQDIFTGADITRILDIPYRNLIYLFESRRLKTEQFKVVGGRRLYTCADVRKIRKVLSEVGKKNGHGRSVKS